MKLLRDRLSADVQRQERDPGWPGMMTGDLAAIAQAEALDRIAAALEMIVRKL